LTLTSACLFGQSNPDTLYVFVGQKLSIKKLPRPADPPGQLIYSYQNYKAKYKVVQNVYGSYSNNTIEFGVNDHYGVPAFSKSKYALLFVYKHNGKLHHVGYQYFDVYKTTNGRWASCGNPFYFDERFKDSVKTPIPVVRLEFPKPVTFKINPSFDSMTIEEVFPKPYFKVEGLTATGLMGSYVEDLFLLKKEGILKQLGYFK
jgi:hypothetical protein